MNKFCDNKFLKIVEEQAVTSFTNNEINVSYDKITSNILSQVSWGLNVNFKEVTDYFFIQRRNIDRLNYYWGQFLKKIALDEVIDLSSSSYIDFWTQLQKLEVEDKMLEYKYKNIDQKNSFIFLKKFKKLITERDYIINFKIKAIQMVNYKQKGVV